MTAVYQAFDYIFSKAMYNTCMLKVIRTATEPRADEVQSQEESGVQLCAWGRWDGREPSWRFLCAGRTHSADYGSLALLSGAGGGALGPFNAPLPRHPNPNPPP